MLDGVVEEIRERGPLCALDLSDHGRLAPRDWSGWVLTSKAGTLALRVLWTRCRLVAVAKGPRGTVYDLPERALPDQHDAPAPSDRARQMVLDRVEAAGLLATAGGPWWSMIGAARADGTVDDLVREGLVEVVSVRGSRRRYLAPAGFRERAHPEPDDRVRILGPLDPLLWNRALVEHAFGFEYVWEVYKPAEQRRWGWYVCPLLHQGRLVGRIEAHQEGADLVVDRLWREDGVPFPDRAYARALARHAQAIAPG